MSKIVEKILEPDVIYTGSKFKFKIKVQPNQYYIYADYLNSSYEDLLNKTYLQIMEVK